VLDHFLAVEEDVISSMHNLNFVSLGESGDGR